MNTIERLKNISFTDIYSYIKDGRLEEYLNEKEGSTTIEEDIKCNGTRCIAIWVENGSKLDEKIVDICLGFRDGKPCFYERLDVNDNKIKPFMYFEDALSQMKHDIISYENIESLKTFEYLGYHFTTVKRLLNAALNLKNITPHLKSDRDLGFSTYDWWENKKDYSHDAFYKACGWNTYDLFKCKENGKYYIPGENELFEYAL